MSLERACWQALQPLRGPARLVFVDETRLHTAMVREWGGGLRGERVRGTAPHSHLQTTTLVLAVRQTGLIAPMVTTGAMTGLLFLAYVKAFLAPTLAAGDLVVWDNLSAHSVAGVREAIEARGAILQPRPPDSPDLNPIEQVFAKLKAKLRAAGERTVDARWKTLGHVLDDFPPAECANFLRGGRLCRTSTLKTL